MVYCHCVVLSLCHSWPQCTFKHFQFSQKFCIASIQSVFSCVTTLKNEVIVFRINGYGCYSRMIEMMGLSFTAMRFCNMVISCSKSNHLHWFPIIPASCFKHLTRLMFSEKTNALMKPGTSCSSIRISVVRILVIVILKTVKKTAEPIWLIRPVFIVGFLGNKRRWILISRLDTMQVHHSPALDSIHLYSSVERSNYD